jgi:hypothetical protein
VDGVIVAIAGDDHDVAGAFDEVLPVLEIVGVSDDLERGLVLEGGLDELPVGVLGEDDEDANRVNHVSLPSLGRCR